jgi:hypothetical protein
MASSKGSPGHKFSSSNDFRLDERRGLLSSSNEDIEHDYKLGGTKSEPLPSKNILITALAFIVLLILGTFSRAMLCAKPDRWAHSKSTKPSELLFSNGTHDFKQTVLVVSIDGLR